jgi:hypothetical protein
MIGDIENYYYPKVSAPIGDIENYYYDASFASKRRIPGICVALLFAWRYWGPPGPGKWADLG